MLSRRRALTTTASGFGALGLGALGLGALPCGAAEAARGPGRIPYGACVARDFLDAIFVAAKPSVIATWGITDRYTWVPVW